MSDKDFKAEHEEDMAAERMLDEPDFFDRIECSCPQCTGQDSPYIFSDSDTPEEDWDSGEYLSDLEQGHTQADADYAEPEYECYVCQRSIWVLEDGIELTFRTGGAQFTVVVCSDDCRALTGA